MTVMSVPACKLVESGLPAMLNASGWTGRGVGYSSRLVMPGSREFGRVSGPVASGLARPLRRGGGRKVQQVGEDGWWQLGGEVGERGAASGNGVDAENLQADSEPEGGYRLAGQHAGEQPRRCGG